MGADGYCGYARRVGVLLAGTGGAGPLTLTANSLTAFSRRLRGYPDHVRLARRGGLDVADVTSMAERSAGRGRLRAAAPAPVSEAPPDALAVPELYLNRELSWLAFNERVLHEAEDERTPLLERIKFLAISASNLDEFFMKRIGGLKQQVVAGLQERTVDGRTPQEQIAAAYAVVRELEQRQREILPRIMGQLDSHAIRLRDYASLSTDERKTIREYYYKN